MFVVAACSGGYPGTPRVRGAACSGKSGAACRGLLGGASGHAACPGDPSPSPILGPPAGGARSELAPGRPREPAESFLGEHVAQLPGIPYPGDGCVISDVFARPGKERSFPELHVAVVV